MVSEKEDLNGSTGVSFRLSFRATTGLSALKVLKQILFLKGVPPFLYILANLCFWLIPLIFLCLMRICLPTQNLQKLIMQLMDWIYSLAVWCDDLLLLHLMGIKIDVMGMRDQYPEGFVIIIANHQSWNDILILQHLFNRRAPVLKFLVKRELIYLPLVGIICWAYGYPFLRRSSSKGRRFHRQKPHGDLILVEKAMDNFMSTPASVVNFVEGTRFSDDKAKRRKSPFRYLLKPKAGGLTTILRALGNRIEIIVDLTIVYDCDKPNFWNFLCGKCRRVIVRAREHSADNIPSVVDYESVDAWITKLWEDKDQEIEKLSR